MSGQAEIASWSPDAIGDLHGKTAIVTGANIGLGKEIARSLASHGARTILAVRDVQKGKVAADDIKATAGPDAQVEVVQVDLASLKSVDEFAKEFREKNDRLDVLVCNAGVMALPERQVTKDGFEMQIGVNHIAHFALVRHLFPLLTATPASRIVHQSSSMSYVPGAKYPASWTADDINCVGKYDKIAQYQFSKLANVAFAKETERRVVEKGLGQPRSVVVHPGYVVGQLQEKSAGSIFERGFFNLTKFLPGASQTYANGALPAVFAATSPLAKGGFFYGPKGFYHGVVGAGGVQQIDPHPNPLAEDKTMWRKLWEATEALVGFKFDI
ncbi:short-chain dehydrogenase/reductase SDR [Gonapodya prolifera JEL478]|uniref:Short-chain dehydrogenase/reductase SDR n=1 Tax=Gonapodya prolifera (strain JEL478) TaxID=1344416 RepID=A0A139AYH7_GONPJ|nr:short-chain dehydrogenase/reductase SDR [Gonapodya prolifera JEL478]|eukprot:KXS21764.1 short-chain dehydrogenase/reductase SDR [Gonapodya prolifera JEL478]